MENGTKKKDGLDSEEISDSFTCCVCLDLLYKPIVLACGHISCFWCIHRSMNAVRESHCPICRHPYSFFPSVCQMLHILLLKMYPLTFKRRENQIFEEEKKIECFSPQFYTLACGLHPHLELNNQCDPALSSTIYSQANLSSDMRYNRIGVPPANMKKSESGLQFQDSETTVSENSAKDLEETKAVVLQENNLNQNSPDGNHKQVLMADVQCPACKQLLFHPVVLNCGHVYCETCIISLDGKLKCQVCQSKHRSGFPKVCLELDHFLEKQFPEEYSMRRDTVRLKEVFQQKSSASCSTDASQRGGLSSVPTEDYGDDSDVHFGAGCDYCGMYPIIGNRYTCKDCVEKMGFDLCGDCYNARSKQPGRFNQQHTPDHRFELERSGISANILSRMRAGDIISFETLFNNIIPLHAIDENSENDLVAPDASDGGDEDLFHPDSAL